MAQFRITAKFAKDIKIRSLADPKEDLHLLDDWIVDVIRLNRKKVAMVTHFLTRITFLIPYAQAGGAPKTIDQIPKLFQTLLVEQGLNTLAEQVSTIFKIRATFCKTKDRSVLGHMNDFKNQIEAGNLMGDSLEHIGHRLHKTLITYRGRMDRPIDYLHELYHLATRH